MCITTTSVAINLPYEILPLNESENAYIEDLGYVCLTGAHWTIAASIELPNFIENIVILKKHIESVSTTCKQMIINNTLEGTRCLEIVSRMKSNFQACQNTFNVVDHLLNPKPKRRRQKRAWFNIIGYASKFLFGTATEEDVQEIDQKLKIIQSQNHRIQNLMHLHTSLINATLSQINETQYDLDKSKTRINEIINRINILEGKENYMALLRHLEEIIILEITKIQHDLDQLLVITHSATVGKCHPLLLHPDDLEEEIKNLSPKLPDGTDFPPLTTSEMYDIAKVIIIGSLDRITAFIQIPLCRKPSFKMYFISALPKINQNSYVMINVQHPYIAVDRRQDFYALLSTHEFKECRQVREIPICPVKVLRTSSVSSCEFSIIRNNAESCTLVPSKANLNIWLHLKNDAFLFILTHERKAQISCLNTPKIIDLTLPTHGIIQLNKNCRINDNGVHVLSEIMLNSLTQTKTVARFGEVRSLNMTLDTVPSLTPLTIDSNTHTKHINDLLQETQNLQNLQSSQNSEIIENIVPHIPGYISLMVVATLGLYIYIKIKNFRNRPTERKSGNRERPVIQYITQQPQYPAPLPSISREQIIRPTITNPIPTVTYPDSEAEEEPTFSNSRQSIMIT